MVALGARELVGDYLLFGLRLNEGIDLGEVGRRCPQVDLDPPRRFLDQLVEEGLLEGRGDQFRVTDRGRLVVDRLGAEVADRLTIVA